MNKTLWSLFDELFENNNKLIGFNDYFSTSEIENNSQPNFPPYNLYSQPTDKGIEYIIEVALAGYDKDSIVLTHNKVSNQLKLFTKISQNIEKNDKKILHTGIAMRNFKLIWKLQPNINFIKATFENGLMKIELLDSSATLKNEEVQLKIQ